MTELGEPSLWHRLWPFRSTEPALPPLRDDEIDPARAPRRNDLVVSCLAALVPGVAAFWESYVELPGLEDHTDFGWALFMGLTMGLLILAISYGFSRATMRTARQRKGVEYGPGTKVVWAAAAAFAVFLFSHWGLTKYGRPTTPEELSVAFLVGVGFGLMTLLLLQLWVDIPPVATTRATTTAVS